MAATVPITILIITKNEEKNLLHALASVCPWAGQVFVLDSGSTDNTRDIAERHGAQFVHHPWEGYARQKNWGLTNLPITTPWIFILDADETITPPLQEELSKIAEENICSENGFYINRHFIFLNQRIRHCGFYPSWNLRFFRAGKARYEDREVHEHMVVDGPVGYLRHEMEHNDRRGLEYYIAKHNQYSTLEARAMFRKMSGGKGAMNGSLLGQGAIMRRRWIKDHLWPRLPARWLARWVYMYILRLGFLDGVAGFHFCLFMAAYEHQITLKLKELMAIPVPSPGTPGEG
jgi:glycosyltransferase involved in cell wall biosynthesis